MVLVPVEVSAVEVSAWTGWFEHRGRNRRDGQQMVFAGVINPLRVSPGGRDLDVDSLAAQLLINRRLAHSADTVEAGLPRAASTGCAQAVGSYEIVCTGCGWVRTTANPTIRPTNATSARPPSGDLTTRFCISL